MTIVPPPTLAGFEAFIRTQMKINTAVLPADADATSTAYQISVELTNLLVELVSPVIYTVMVYNLAGHVLIETAPDVDPEVIYKDDLPYFAYFRKFFGLTSFVAGVIQSTSDEGTSQSMSIPQMMENLTIADLQYLKTPWGRIYAQYAAMYGNIVGVS